MYPPILLTAYCMEGWKWVRWRNRRIKYRRSRNSEMNTNEMAQTKKIKPASVTAEFPIFKRGCSRMFDKSPTSFCVSEFIRKHYGLRAPFRKGGIGCFCETKAIRHDL